MLNTILTVLPLISTVVVLYLAFKIYRNAPPWIDDKIEGLLATFFEPNEEGKNLVDVVSERFGKGFRMSMLGQKSGEVRHTKAIEKRVFQAVMDKSPEMKIGMKVLEEFGLGDLATPENLPSLIQIANKYGLFGMLKGNPTSRAREGYGGKM